MRLILRFVPVEKRWLRFYLIRCLPGCCAGCIFAGTRYGTWNCKCLFSGTGHGADQGRDWILHGTKQRLGGKNGISDQGSETHATALFINNC